MPHLVHELVANCVCLLVGAEQTGHDGFLDERNKTEPQEGQKTKTMS